MMKWSDNRFLAVSPNKGKGVLGSEESDEFVKLQPSRSNNNSSKRVVV